MKTLSGSTRIRSPTWKLPAVSHSQAVEGCERADGASPQSFAKTTTEAATAITASAKIWPLDSPCRRENAIRARFAPLSMISSESSTISGLRRRRTPRTPVANRNAATARYQAMSGPRTDLSFVDQLAGRRRAARVCAEDDRADRRDEQHDRGDLEREQMVG